MGETLLDHWTPDEIASEEYAGWDLARQLPRHVSGPSEFMIDE